MQNNLQYSTSSSDFVKIYPDFLKLFRYKTPEQTYQQKKSKQKNAPASSLSSLDGISLNELRSIRRTKTIISDIVLCNQFDMFATFTFSTDREDIQKCKRKMSQWLQSQNKLSPFKYLIVAEYHKDKKAIHFHALLQNFRGKLKTAKNPKTKKNIKNKQGNNRYNVISYKSGWSTVDLIQSRQEQKIVSSYIRKYISKDMIITSTKKRYWCSSGLRRPIIKLAKHYEDQLLLTSFQLVYETELYELYETNASIENTLVKKEKPQCQVYQLSPQKLISEKKSIDSLSMRGNSKRKMVVSCHTQY